MKIDKFVLNHSQSIARPDASAHQVQNVKIWLSNSNEAIHDDETRFITQEGDLIAMVTREKSPLRLFVERYDLVKYLCYFKPSMQALPDLALLQLLIVISNSLTGLK